MKRILKFSRLIPLLGLVSVSCTGDRDVITATGPDEENALTINFTVAGSSEVITRAVAGSAAENAVNHIYTLFFDQTSDATGTYLTHVRSGASSSGGSGTSTVTLPSGFDPNDAYSMIIIANFDNYADLGSWSSGSDMIEGLLTGKTQHDARTLLRGYASASTGHTTPFLMSSETDKSTGSKSVAVTLTRAIARANVKNSAAEFELVSAQVWNARKEGNVVKRTIPFDVTGNSHGHYNDKVVTVDATGAISTGLYFFENYSMTPGQDDMNTTCLIIGGRYNGEPQVTYYRVNICHQGQSQIIERNHIYTINITSVSSSGETDPGGAHNNDNIIINYTINDWDDTYSAAYVFDANGNGLAVSHRFVTFGSPGQQMAEVNVYLIKSTVNPISSNWTLSLSGDDATSFSASSADYTDNTFIISTLTENTSDVDRLATVNVTWGTLSVPVGVTQLNPSSQANGMTITPSSLWFDADGDTKLIQIGLLGDYTGITVDDINVNILYTSENHTGWLVLTPNAVASDPSNGLFTYTVGAGPLDDEELRNCYLRFTVDRGGKMSTGLAYVTQSYMGNTEEGYIRNMRLSLLLQKSGGTYEDYGMLVFAYDKFVGMPEGMTGTKHLHFAITNPTYIKYRFNIQSSMGWRITPSGLAAQYLDFGMLSHPGTLTEEVEFDITARQDLLLGWSGTFTFEFDNGDATVYHVHQRGVLHTHGSHIQDGTNNTIVADDKIYYYGTMIINGEQWLDRDIGATEPGWYSNSALPEEPSNENARGVYFTISQAQGTACPSGYRLPHCTDTEKEWGRIARLNQVSPNDGVGMPVGPNREYIQNHAYHSYSVDLDDQYDSWCFNLSGNSAQPSLATTYYATDNMSVSHHTSTTYRHNGVAIVSHGSKLEISSFLSTTGLGRFSVRCIRDTDYE